MNRILGATALIFGFALATAEGIRKLLRLRHPTAVVHILDEIPEPPHFYIKVDQRVFAVKLRD